MHLGLQLNLSIKDTLNKGNLSNEDTVCSPNHIELCTNLPLNQGHHSIQGSQLGLNGVLYGENTVCTYVHAHIYTSHSASHLFSLPALPRGACNSAGVCAGATGREGDLGGHAGGWGREK